MKKKNKKLIIIIIIILVVILGAILFINGKKKSSAGTNYSYVRTVDIKHEVLQETIVASGTIESQVKSSITTQLNASVSKINFNVGDYVKAGDVVIELDTDNLNKQITNQTQNYTKAKNSLQHTYDNAVNDYNDVQNDYDDAKNYRNALGVKLYQLESQINSYKNTLNYETILDTYNNAVNACLAEGKACELFDESSDEYKNYDQASKALESANKTIQALKDQINYDEISSAYNSANTKYKSLESSLESQEKVFNNAQYTYDEGVDSTQLRDLNESANDYKLTAKTSGQITNISAVLGSTASGVLATIQDTAKLKISLVIEEFDILRLKLGMKALINTDASDKTYEGEITMISPTANDNGGFEIEVSVTSNDVSDLLIGMNSEVTIVINEGELNYSVPLDAVKDKSDGTSVIYVKNEAGGFDEVKVTKGYDNGYYVEVFGNLHDGMKVRASANVSEASVNTGN